MIKLPNQKITRRWKRRPRSTKSSFKYIFWSLGLVIIFYALDGILWLSEYLDFWKKPCLITDIRANTMRIDGGTKMNPEDLLGSWEYLKTVYQYDSWNNEPLDLSDWGKEFQRRNCFILISEDSLSQFEFPYSLKYTCSYKYDRDSIYISGDTKEAPFYHGNSNAFEMFGDTLVLISFPDGPCREVIYEYYLKADSLTKELMALKDKKVNWSLTQYLWRREQQVHYINSSSYPVYGSDWERALPEYLDLRASNTANYRLEKDVLFYNNDSSTFKFKFRDTYLSEYAQGRYLDLISLSDAEEHIITYRVYE